MFVYKAVVENYKTGGHRRLRKTNNGAIESKRSYIFRTAFATKTRAIYSHGVERWTFVTFAFEYLVEYSSGERDDLAS